MGKIGLDTTSSYKYKTLESRYKGFLAPDFVIHVGSMKLDSHMVPVSNLEVRMDLQKAGYARFTVESLYDFKESTWVSKLITGIDIGQLVSVEVGYAGDLTQIFLGFVDSYTVNFRSSSTPSVSIVAMDGMVILNHDKRKISFGNMKEDAAIQKMIKDCKLDDVVKKVSFDPIKIEGQGEEKEGNVSIGQYISQKAAECFYSFCIINGELIFKNLMNNKKSLMTLTMGVDLRSFSRTVNLKSRMVDSVRVVSQSDTVSKEPVEGQSTQIEGKGKAPGDVKLLKKSQLVVNLGQLRTVDECKKYANTILRTLTFGYLEADAECIGYPQMTPGRYVTLSGLDKRSNGDYFVTSVVHSFSQDGYTNQIHMKGFKDR